MTVHLTRAYTPQGGLRRPKAEQAIAACSRKPGLEQVSVYDEPENEKLITCPDCLIWLNEGDNRLLVVKDGVEQWIRNHVNDTEIYSTGIPSGETHRVTEDDL